MSDVSSEFFRGILSRVPVQPLLRFRCVCKSWLKIIDDPAFIKSHLHRQSGGTQIIMKNTRGSKLFTFSIDSLISSKTHPETIWVEHLKTPTRNGVLRIPDLPVSACNGLILISHYDSKELWTLRNPFTRDFLELPPYDNVTCTEYGGMACGGIGYDRISDDYKVVRIAQMDGSDDDDDDDDNTLMLETLVYNLKLGYWRRVKDFPNCNVPFLNQHGVFINGALHWRTYVGIRGQERECIIAFDLVTENYRLLQLPSDLPECQDSDKRLDVLGECLVLSHCHWCKRLDGWILNDYGGKNTWTMLFSIKRHHNMGELRPLAYLKNKGLVLLQHDRGEFLWYDVEKKSTKRFKIHGAPSNMSSQVLPTSLFRLIDDSSDDSSDDDGSIASTTGMKRKGAKRRKKCFRGDIWMSENFAAYIQLIG